MKAFGFAAILSIVGMTAACTVTSGDGDTSGDGGSGASGASGSTTSSATTGEGGSGGAGEGGAGGSGGGGEVCADAGTEDECTTCCDDTYPEAVEALAVHAIAQCGCAADSPCASVCDTTDATTDACNDDGTVNLDASLADCVACLGDLADDEACVDATGDACEADAECNPYFECLSTCQ